MLHEKPVRCDAPAGAGAGDEKRAWTGQKRRKYRGPSLTRDSGETACARTSSSSSDARGETIARDHEEPPDEIARAMVRDNDMIAPSDSPDELADLENDIISKEEFLGYLEALYPRHAITISMRRLDDARQREVYERLALYRIRACKLSEGACRDELDDVTLRKEYSPDTFEDLYYFEGYEQADDVDWYFDSDYSVLADLGDYQRLVLKNGDGTRYLDWENYHSCFTSYEMDEEYVKCCEEISKKIKWIKRYVECERTSCEWIKMDCRGFHQAAKIAAEFPHMSFDLAVTAYMEHIWNMRFDYAYRDDIDRLLFEIWKRVTKQKMAFRDALKEVHREDLVPRHKKYMQFALDHSNYYDLKSNFDTCVEGIPDDAPEDEAHELITSAVWDKLHKQKLRHQYIMRKMEIAKHIGLDPRAGPVCYEEDGDC